MTLDTIAKDRMEKLGFLPLNIIRNIRAKCEVCGRISETAALMETNLIFKNVVSKQWDIVDQSVFVRVLLRIRELSVARKEMHKPLTMGRLELFCEW